MADSLPMRLRGFYLCEKATDFPQFLSSYRSSVKTEVWKKELQCCLHWGKGIVVDEQLHKYFKTHEKQVYRISITQVCAAVAFCAMGKSDPMMAFLRCCLTVSPNRFNYSCVCCSACRQIKLSVHVPV